MGLSRIRIGATALVALLLGGALPAAAQSFGGMSMLDMEAERDSFFQSADADGDFALSTDEQMSALEQRHAKLLECWDADGDGLCSYSEFLESGEKLFSDLDVKRRRCPGRRRNSIISIY
ncbi:MAG: EF-hand domain-containing protein [Rhodospirillales bacterium]|nr:EF-hand domain-containing protein [Rhodospirillales bacterium]